MQELNSKTGVSPNAEGEQKYGYLNIANGNQHVRKYLKRKVGVIEPKVTITDFKKNTKRTEKGQVET